MGVVALVVKDLREHAAATVLLTLSSVALVALAIAQNRAAAFSMSPFEVVRFALITFLPLVVLTVGNRLIVREYLSGTRLFVEALPVGVLVPLTVKYLMGAFYVLALGAVLVALSALGTSAADDVTLDFLAILLAKTSVVLLLYWSIVFCFSLCGHLRIVLYVLLIGITAFIAWSSAIDATEFPPFQLMDRDLFVFERDEVPLTDMLWTLCLAAAFAFGGFLVARLGNGSVAERLARPMTRRDFVALGVLATAGLGLASALVDDQSRQPIRFGNSTVLRNVEPAIEMYYASDSYLSRSESFLLAVKEAIEPLQSVLGVEDLPIARLALRPAREAHDIDYGTLDGVYVAANWLDHASYDDTVLVAVVLHGLLSARTGGRAPFGPHHWVLDGFTRWWSETLGDPQRLRADHRDELMARAIYVTSKLDSDADLVDTWQIIADRFGYPSAEALAFSAMHYLSLTRGPEAVFAVGRAFLAEPVGTSILASVRDRRRPSWQRFEQASGLSRDAFVTGWAQWLASSTQEPGVARLLAAIPPVLPVVSVRQDASGVPEIVAGYQEDPSATGMLERLESTRCMLRYGALTAFDVEYEVDDEDERVADCRIADDVHIVRGRHAAGDRVYVALDVDSPLFHQDFRLDSRRLEVP